ncbi:hypothetical protein CO058_02215 [candidate division WWE3 bacterium CG_4_9_14_0_2_um_filter_35_11]|uniref:Uncharacterized protein n=1 Tax=candidate division WWE3 bacterium CG_4_9_14_0_2_um_filter_35_11 TaxID=1975077 RepID=A0A2M8ELP7_UNCKA|nr:MAG: hypothetical protein COV25_00505 [candidate division WWE3 bacterium CG10_big_fil_rev_8_21_14_0_10_35_32]PJC23664.1 MAG: hypothetical protein CO058_02215 [candidate division WWE3 bacterium CG_4_9_14_0_2_um_filter_35_11]
MTGFKDQFLKKLNSLSKVDKKLFDQIYSFWETKGELALPTEMDSWVQTNFGSIADVKKQDFIRITNTVTYEGAIFNELRTMRPLVESGYNFNDVMDQIKATEGDPFLHPETGTPADVFGRVKGDYCITASNVAKYDGFHGLIIFDDHNPLLFSRKRVRDYFDVAYKWFEKANKYNPLAIYPLFTWNCLWRAGASVIHGHAQVVLTESQAYAKVEDLRISSHNYQERNRSNYFDDVYEIHKKFGLAYKVGDVRVLVNITPIKEKEIMIFGMGLNKELADVVSDTLNTMKERLGVSSFNLSIILPPLSKTAEVWEHMPIIVRIVDRGSLSAKTSDIGSMELYAQSVIGSNPYLVFDAIKR